MKREQYDYPWDRWLKKRSILLRRGIDYRCQSHCLGILARGAAKNRKIRVRVQIDGDTVTLVRKD